MKFYNRELEMKRIKDITQKAKKKIPDDDSTGQAQNRENTTDP